MFFLDSFALVLVVSEFLLFVCAVCEFVIYLFILFIVWFAVVWLFVYLTCLFKVCFELGVLWLIDCYLVFKCLMNDFGFCIGFVCLLMFCYCPLFCRLFVFAISLFV